MTLRVDIYEPAEGVGLFRPVVPVRQMALNSKGFADYLWQGVDRAHQVERKQWGELLGDLDSVENQLREEMQAHPDVETMLLVEGVAVSSLGGTQTFTRSRNKTGLFISRNSYRLSLDAVYAWLYQVSGYMRIFFTADFPATVCAITRFYLADQKAEHNTFQRHLKTATWHPNPQVRKLMALVDGIGEEKAKELIETFGTVWQVLNMGPEHLQICAGIGPKLARKILREVGRTDV